MNPWAYWWIRWAVLGGALINAVVVAMLIARGVWYVTFPNVAVIVVSVWVSCWWAPRFRARTERARRG